MSSNTFSAENPVIGALLGTQAGREVSIVNTFDLVLLPSSGDDVSMEGDAKQGSIDLEFLEMRKDQCMLKTLKSPDASQTGISHSRPDRVVLYRYPAFSSGCRNSQAASTRA